MPFEVHPRIAAGGFLLARHSGCHIFLKDNALFPWFIIVPEVAPEIEDLHQLDEVRYREVMATVRAVSVFVADHYTPTKLNVACIGNQVRQMHIHVVARSTEDPAWPGVVWSFGDKVKYEAPVVTALQRSFAERTGMKVVAI